jgi:glycosyltransferase involved in cell wall biosynthesis
MAIYNGGATVTAAIESVMSQLNKWSELVIIDDGSTDETIHIARREARQDSRIRVVQSKHGGLTNALILGCETARGKYIARQDADDMSLPGRFEAQLALFRKNPDLSLVGCGTKFVSDEGDFLFTMVPDVKQVVNGIDELENSDSIDILAHHGSAMFPIDKYNSVGGYRRQFYYAQDKDLFLRLLEVGEPAIIEKVLYQATFNGAGISGVSKQAQSELEALSIACARTRRKRVGESQKLEAARLIRPSSQKMRNNRSEADGHYFVAACLRRNRNRRARRYYLKALAKWPFHARALLGAINSLTLAKNS